MWSLIEDIFNPSNIEEAKHKLELVVFNALKLVRRDEDAVLVPHACREESVSSQTSEGT